MHLIPKSAQQSSAWSGGTTTQLYIYPDTAEYAKRDFEFRISTAMVETDTSSFTSLPGFTRILMILKGELSIQHEGHYSKQLKAFESDRFDGGWQTTAEGLVTDFNIMFTHQQNAVLVAHQLPASSEYRSSSDAPHSFGYLVAGKALLNGTTTILASDFLVLAPGESSTLRAETDCTWLTIEVY